MKTFKLLMVLGLIVSLLMPAAVWADLGVSDRDGGGGGGGGHTEVVGNNLSFPVIMADGMELPGSPGVEKFTIPYNETADDMGIHFFAQKEEGNSWQAASKLLDPNPEEPFLVSEVDWGDSLESVPMKVGRPVRIEATFYKTGLQVGTDWEPMTAYTMTMLANPSSPDEIQGAGVKGWELNEATGEFEGAVQTYPSTEATIYSSKVELAIQYIQDPDILLDPDAAKWNDTDHKWESEPDGAFEDPINPTFSSELNVGGKVIYGLSQGGWRPQTEGTYRITIYLLDAKQVSLEKAAIRAQDPEEAINAVEDEGPGGGSADVEGATATYIDVNVIAGGGGGGGKPNNVASSSAVEFPFEVDELVAVDVKPNACPNIINIDMPGSEGNGNGGPGNGGGNGSGNGGSEAGGKVRVAALGSEALDVSQIQADSVRLRLPVGEELVELIPEDDKTVIEDIATPNDLTFEEPLDAYACQVAGADGFDDINFMFEASEIAAHLEGVEEGTTMLFYLSGKLTNNNVETTFGGADVTLINASGPPAEEADDTVGTLTYLPLVQNP